MTIADIIGDLDPIKAARGGHILSDELTIHYGMLPRANRGIFALNELPDLAGKVQVGLFNIMQEGDVQIKGYPVRLPLDVLLCFTANPEDYTARGKIITPLKDRIGSEIMTHYPETVELGMAITQQEAWTERGETPVRIPDFIAEVVERVAFEARTDKRIDKRSGVSQRMPISVIENVVSNAERRAIVTGEDEIVPRISDVYAALPAITGKIELEYEGELVGGHGDRARADPPRGGRDVPRARGRREHRRRGDVVRRGRRAAGDGRRALGRAWRRLRDGARAWSTSCIASGSRPRDDAATTVAACELVLEALVARKKISRTDGGQYGRAEPERRRRPKQDLFGGGMSA